MFTELKLAVAAIALIGSFVLGGAIGYKIEAGKLSDLKLAYAQAETKARDEAAAIQKAQDDVAISQAQLEATAQAGQASLTEKQIDEIKTYVPAGLVLASQAPGGQPCIPYGFVRVLDAAALGSDPVDLQLPAGQSDGSCAPVDPTTVARSIIANYGAARENAEQLNRLEETVRALRKASDSPADRKSP